MDICIDFDGTCVTHAFPEIGKDIGAIPILKALIKKGHKLILFTMRSDIKNPISIEYDIHPKGGDYLTEAVNWFTENDILLSGVNINPGQISWTYSPKAYGQLYIDDAALGCPLLYNEEKPYVDWDTVEDMLKYRGIL